jgi:hypothetical protein
MGYNDSMGSKRAAWEKANAKAGGVNGGYLTAGECKVEILAELKAAAKDSKSPLFGLRITLREPHHKSFNVTLADAPFAIYQTGERERVEYSTRRNNHPVAQNDKGEGLLWHTAAADAAISAVEAIAGEWNYDRSDIQTDYFDVGFYLSVSFNADQAGAERHAMLLAGGTKDARRAQVFQNMRAVLNDKLQESGQTLVESVWGRTFDTLVVKLFGKEAHTAMMNEANSVKDAERFDVSAAEAAGAVVVAARSAGKKNFRDNAARVNEAAAKAAKAKVAESAVEVTKAVTELTGAAKAWATRRARAAQQAKAVAS